MLVGDVPLYAESDVFAMLCEIEEDCVIEKGDPIGKAKSVEFEIELVDPNCKPVCHKVQLCSARKQWFIDELDKMLRMGVCRPILTNW